MCESSRDELRQSGDGRSVIEVVGAGDGVCFVPSVINSRFQSYSVR